MKILLDECVTKRLKPLLTGCDVFTVKEMKWSGIRNGKLMSLCVENGFDVLLTIDKNLMHQQNLDKIDLTVAVFNSNTSKVEELTLFLGAFKSQCKTFEKRRAYLIDK